MELSESKDTNIGIILADQMNCMRWLTFYYSPGMYRTPRMFCNTVAFSCDLNDTLYWSCDHLKCETTLGMVKIWTGPEEKHGFIEIGTVHRILPTVMFSNHCHFWLSKIISKWKQYVHGIIATHGKYIGISSNSNNEIVNCNNLRPTITELIRSLLFTIQIWVLC